MDFRSVTGVTIPAGNVNKISIGGVVYWNKPASDNAQKHNEVYIDKDLREFTNTISARIRNGSFTDINPGNYFDFTNVAYSYLDENDETQSDTYTGRMRIMHLDYPQCCGDIDFAKHCILVVPDLSMFSARMDSVRSTAGGYAGTEMRQKHLRRAEAIFKACFGADHVLTYTEYLVNEVTNNKGSGGDYYNCTVELLDERMIFGEYKTGTHDSTVATEEYVFPHIKLAAFKYRFALAQTYEYWWLRNIVSDVTFGVCNGSIISMMQSDPTSEYGVRPFVLIC